MTKNNFEKMDLEEAIEVEGKVSEDSFVFNEEENDVAIEENKRYNDYVEAKYQLSQIKKYQKIVVDWEKEHKVK